MGILGLYVHIPFCRQKCAYCDFPSQTGSASLQKEYVEALCEEIAWQGNRLGKVPVDTIFLGGGTPTIIGSEALARLMQELQRWFFVLPEAEISLEANPGTVSADDLRLLRAAGFNRLSLGVQSFDDALLQNCGRIHDGAAATAALEAARQAGFDNCNVDLMTGLPGQTLALLQQSVHQAAKLSVAHLSIYALKIEEGTSFARLEEAGSLALPEEDEVAAMDQWLESWLPAHGYRRYEISNYAQKKRACRHNLRYWRFRPYLGLGAAAHSFMEGRRWEGCFPLQRYLSLSLQERWESGMQAVLTSAQEQEEFCFLALRTKGGISHYQFKATFGVELWQRYALVLEQLVAEGLVEKQRGRTCLTPLGLRFGNRAFAAFLETGLGSESNEK
jgi:oxygen-independent coproporphyrinogen-3 oxidase